MSFFLFFFFSLVSLVLFFAQLPIFIDFWLNESSWTNLHWITSMPLNEIQWNFIKDWIERLQSNEWEIS
jgi:hypothetical protein